LSERNNFLVPFVKELGSPKNPKLVLDQGIAKISEFIEPREKIRL